MVHLAREFFLNFASHFRPTFHLLSHEITFLKWHIYASSFSGPIVWQRPALCYRYLALIEEMYVRVCVCVCVCEGVCVCVCVREREAGQCDQMTE